MTAQIPVRLFDRDGEVYADCADFDLMATGDTDDEAVEFLGQALVAYFGARSLGLPEPGVNLRNRLLRIAFPTSDNDRFVFVPEPDEKAVAEHAQQLRETLEHMRQAPA